MEDVSVTFKILNEEIIGLCANDFCKLIENVLFEGFGEKGIVIEINKLSRY